MINKTATLTTPYGHIHTLTRDAVTGVITDENGNTYTTSESEWISDYGALYASNQESQIMYWHELPCAVQYLFRNK